MPEQKPAPESVSISVTGPALFYISTAGPNGIQQVQRADLEPPTDPRERALSRALLLHALALLDASQPTRPYAVSGERS
jgi:hypothetical protein